MGSDGQEIAKVYKIFAISRCGSYLVSYLKTMTVIAGSKEQALQMGIDFVEKEKFILAKQPSEWEVVEIATLGKGVIDYLHDSDY